MTNTGRNPKVWGALVTDPTGRGEVPTGYHARVTWEPLSVIEEAFLFPQFLELARPTQVVGGRECPAAEGLLLLAPHLQPQRLRGDRRPPLVARHGSLGMPADRKPWELAGPGPAYLSHAIGICDVTPCPLRDPRLS